jgi:protein involved in polysaccharide export with SLBB domain
MRVFLLLSIFLSAMIPVASGQVSSRVQSGPVLQVGDVIRISVWRKPELSGEFKVSADSTIADPFYMSVRVAGVPLSVVSERVRSHVALYETDPQVLVEPLFSVAVGGEVRQPGLHTVPPGTTVSQAYMLAGGATERGRAQRARLVRLEGEYVVDLTRPQEGMANARIESGDFILVDRRAMIFRDYIAPAGSVVGAAASLLHIFLRLR